MQQRECSYAERRVQWGKVDEYNEIDMYESVCRTIILFLHEEATPNIIILKNLQMQISSYT